MKERPIIFTTESVVAILEGRKTQTRRVVTSWNDQVFKCPFGEPGDRLWVRETWATSPFIKTAGPGDKIFYKADPDINDSHYSWRSPMFMPHWASRLTLEVARVRVERVQEISNADVEAEGVPEEFITWQEDVSNIAPPGSHIETTREHYAYVWDTLNARRGYGWEKNPWVWVVEFKVLE